MNLREYVYDFAKTQTQSFKSSYVLQIIFLLLFFPLVWILYSSNAFQKGYGVTILCFWVIIGWYVAKGLFRTRDFAKNPPAIDPETYLNFLWQYGVKDTVLSELENELDSPVFIGVSASGRPYFYITDTWVVDLSALPEKFAFKISEIEYVEGQFPPILYTRIGRQPKFYFIFHYYDSYQTTVPLYTPDEHKQLIRFLRSHKRNMEFEFPTRVERYFEKIFNEAVEDEKTDSLAK